MGRKKHRKFTPQERNRIRRLASQLYIYRYEDGDTKMYEKFGFRTPFVKPEERDYLHDTAIALPLPWQCVSITYCEDDFGKKYRLFGFAMSRGSFIGESGGIVPLLEDAKNHAEETANAKHIYGRAMVIAPWSKHFPDLIPVIRSLKEPLKLYDSDIDAIQDEIVTSVKTTSFNIMSTDDIDTMIAQYL